MTPSSPLASGSGPLAMIIKLARDGVRWWLAELAGLAPPALRRAFGGDRAFAAVLAIGPRRVVFSPSPLGRARPAAIDLTDIPAEERIARLRAVQQRRNAKLGATTVSLAPALLFDTVLELPLAAEPSLAPLLRNQIDRLVPMSPDQVCYGWRILSRDAKAGRMGVQLVIAKRTVVDAALAEAREAGLSPDRVIAAEPEAPGPRRSGQPQPSPLVVWRATALRQAGRSRWRLHRGLELLAVGLCVTAYVWRLSDLATIRLDLAARLKSAEQPAAVVREAQRQLAQTSGALSFLQQQRDRTQPTDVLSELTRVTPLDSWVQQFTFDGKEVEIIGLSPKASDLIGRIDDSPLFGPPRFRAPVTPSPENGMDRFDLSFEVLDDDPSSNGATPQRAE